MDYFITVLNQESGQNHSSKLNWTDMLFYKNVPSTHKIEIRGI